MIEIKVKSDELQEAFLRAITKGTLSNREYSILAECCKEKTIDTEVRKNIQKKLGISQFSLNNVLSKFKDVYFVKCEDGTVVVPEVLRVAKGKAAIKFVADE